MSGQGQPSRYTRSFNGMTGALIVTVLAVLAFVAWRGLWRSDVDTETEAVDWQARVELAQQADLRVVHPRELPAGWTATSTELAAGDDPRWSLGVLTDDGRFVGIRQQDTSVSDLVELYVDEDAEAGDDATVVTSVAQAAEGAAVSVRVADGRIHATTDRIERATLVEEDPDE